MLQKLLLSILLSLFIFSSLDFHSHSSFASSNDDISDPYRILGVQRRASTKDIKRAYKELARRWHPDKNSNPGASEKFVRINRAYEILGDAKRKARFDRTGETEENPNHHGGGGHYRNQHYGDPFANFFGGGRFQTPEIFTKYRVGLRMYEQTILAESWHKPYLIFIYSDACFTCVRAESIWERVVNHLEPMGYGIATVNSMYDGALIEKLRVRYEPSIVAVVEGRLVHFPGHKIDYQSILDFATQSLPSSGLIAQITDSDYRRWMRDNWRLRNKMTAVLCNDRGPRIRFVLAAMRYRTYVEFGYVQMRGQSTEEFRHTYGVSTSNKVAGGLETLMLFNERNETPVVVVQAKEIQTESLNSAVESNKFLLLPRLSSQAHFDQLCPIGGHSYAPERLCVILSIRATEAQSTTIHLDGFREFAENSTSTMGKRGPRFAYVYEDRQKEFVDSLISSMENEQKDDADGKQRISNGHHVIVLWRTETHRARVALFQSIWSGRADAINTSVEMLREKMETIMYLRGGSDDLFKRSTTLERLIDENTPVWYARWTAELIRIWDSTWYFVTKEELFPLLSVLATVVVMVVLKQCIDAFTSRTQPDPKPRASPAKSNGSSMHNDESSDDKFGIRELNARTYSELITNAEPGARTIVVMLTRATKDTVLRRFKHCMLPWKEHNFKLAYITLENHFDWFKNLCVESSGRIVGELNLLEHERDSDHYVGVVCSFVGYRKYFNIYHSETSISDRSENHHRQHDFLCLDSENDENNGNSAALAAMDGLPTWLERLFEGVCQKYTIDEWPSIR